jgi:hypothetical protein
MSKKLYAAHILKLILVAVFFYAITTLLINAVVTSPAPTKGHTFETTI